MDPAYLNWVRASVGVVPDMQIVNKILHQLQPPVAFDIPSTRHLIQRVISLMTKQSKDHSSNNVSSNTNNNSSNGVTKMPQMQSMLDNNRGMKALDASVTTTNEDMDKMFLHDMNGLLSLCASLSHI